MTSEQKKLEEVCGQVLCMSSVSSLGRALMWCCSGSFVDRPWPIQVSLSQERLDERVGSLCPAGGGVP